LSISFRAYDHSVPRGLGTRGRFQKPTTQSLMSADPAQCMRALQFPQPQKFPKLCSKSSKVSETLPDTAKVSTLGLPVAKSRRKFANGNLAADTCGGRDVRATVGKGGERAGVYPVRY
jgi:hypothetical protein